MYISNNKIYNDTLYENRGTNHRVMILMLGGGGCVEEK